MIDDRPAQLTALYERYCMTSDPYEALKLASQQGRLREEFERELGALHALTRPWTYVRPDQVRL